jgi:hypothetical protein
MAKPHPSRIVAAVNKFLKRAGIACDFLILVDIYNKYKSKPPVRAISGLFAAHELPFRPTILVEFCPFFVEDGLHFLPKILKTCFKSLENTHWRVIPNGKSCPQSSQQD